MHGQCAERFGFLDDNIHEALGQGGGGVLHDLLDVLQGLCQRGVGHAIGSPWHRPPSSYGRPSR